MTDSAPKQEPPYGLRMPPDLKARVKAAAQSNNRSMNAEIVATLQERYPAPSPLGRYDPERMSFIIKEISRLTDAIREAKSPADTEQLGKRHQELIEEAQRMLE